jgi:hypothetical protein
VNSFVKSISWCLILYCHIFYDLGTAAIESEGGSSKRKLRPRVSKGRAEAVDDLGGDTGTRSDDNVEDETYVDYCAYERRMRHGKGPASHHSDEEGEDIEGEEDLGGQERDLDDEHDDPIDEDDGGNAGGLLSPFTFTLNVVLSIMERE